MQTAMSRIWTDIKESISYDNNWYQMLKLLLVYYVNIYYIGIYPTPLPQAGCDTKSIC